MKHSAGILAYKLEQGKIKVFLEHMGGPYWQNVKEGSWSIPKGELKKEEKMIEGALREFYEESGYSLSKEKLEFLASLKQKNNKLVTVFMIEKDLDPTKVTSNLFQLEWPKNSGKICEFPEMDEAAWIEIEEAKKLILKGQVKFLEKLEDKLSEK